MHLSPFLGCLLNYEMNMKKDRGDLSSCLPVSVSLMSGTEIAEIMFHFHMVSW